MQQQTDLEAVRAACARTRDRARRLAHGSPARLSAYQQVQRLEQQAAALAVRAMVAQWPTQ